MLTPSVDLEIPLELKLATCLQSKTYHPYYWFIETTDIMANLQKIVISLLLMLTAGFLFLAQTSSAAKGPKITHKVGNPSYCASTAPC